MTKKFFLVIFISAIVAWLLITMLKQVDSMYSDSDDAYKADLTQKMRKIYLSK